MLRAVLKHVPSWNNRVAWCAVVKNVHFWKCFRLALCKLRHRNKWRVTSYTVSLKDIIFCPRYDKVCSLPIWNTFQKCAFFSEQHTMLIWKMFQDSTCFRTERNTCTWLSYVWAVSQLSAMNLMAALRDEHFGVFRILQRTWKFKQWLSCRADRRSRSHISNALTYEVYS